MTGLLNSVPPYTADLSRIDAAMKAHMHWLNVQHRPGVGILSNMKATELLRTRIVVSEVAFAEVVLWRVPTPVAGSDHAFKYRLAYVVNGNCVVRYDNEAGKGDHRHVNGKERAYVFQTPDKLLADFQRDITRWNHENRHA